MWNALRSDLKEFVSTVTEDTSQVLSKIDDSFPVLNTERGLSPEEQEALRRMKLDETYTSPLVILDDGGSGGGAGEEEEGRLAAQRAELNSFVASFEVTEDLTKDLDDNPDLRDAYDRLVPDVVTERDFWMRYAYRCDADRIAAEWDSDDEEDDEEKEESKDRSGAAVAQSLSSVTQFLGGAVKSVAASLKEADVQGGGTGDGDDLVAGDVTTTTTTTAAGFFGVGGARPPFVMNTAVDEDDDDGAQDDEEDEELGWDDDDEDEDDDRVGDDDDGQHQDSTQEEIEFRDAATEQLQEQLKQALEERDQLHETVAMQAKKIVDLMAQVSEGRSDAAGADVEALKMKLFEAESELAAVKEGIVASPSFEEPPTPKQDESSSSSGAAPDAELQRRTEELLAKLEVAEGLCSSLRTQVAELEVVCAELRNEKEEYIAKVASLQSVVETMEQDKSRAEERALEVAEQQEGLARELQAKLEMAERRIVELEQGLAEASRSANAASPETHESTASGVKVDAPSPASMEHLGGSPSLATPRAADPPVVAAPTPPPVVEQEEGGEEGSDWGDEW